MPLWQKDDVIYCIHQGSVIGGTQRRPRLAVWSPDGSTLRGVYDLQVDGDTSTGHYNFRWPYVYFSYTIDNITGGSTCYVARANGATSGHEIIDSFPYGDVYVGVDVDRAGNIYYYKPLGSLNGIRILKPDLSEKAYYTYAAGDPNLGDFFGQAACLGVTRDGSIVYFADLQPNFGNSSLDEIVNRLDVASGQLLPFLDISSGLDTFMSGDFGGLDYMILDNEDHIITASQYFTAAGEAITVFDSSGQFIHGTHVQFTFPLTDPNSVVWGMGINEADTFLYLVNANGGGNGAIRLNGSGGVNNYWDPLTDGAIVATGVTVAARGPNHGGGGWISSTLIGAN